MLSFTRSTFQSLIILHTAPVRERLLLYQARSGQGRAGHRAYSFVTSISRRLEGDDMLFNFVSAPSALVECPHWGLAGQTHVLVWLRTLSPEDALCISPVLAGTDSRLVHRRSSENCKGHQS